MKLNSQKSFLLFSKKFFISSTSKRSSESNFWMPQGKRCNMANELSNLHPCPGERRPRKRVGRGEGSGKGKTAGRGTKGQHSRSGYSTRPGFEGGQMPLHRRLPKRGFVNIFKKHYEIVNVEQLSRCAGTDPITPEVMKEKGLIKKIGAVKILGVGELNESMNVHAHKFSRSAQAKIEKSGGKVINL